MCRREEKRNGITSMPWCTNSVSHLPLVLARSYCHNLSDRLMAWDNWEAVAPGAPLDALIRSADARSEDFDEHLASLGLLQLDILQRERGVGLLEHGSLVGPGKSHGRLIWRGIGIMELLLSGNWVVREGREATAGKRMRGHIYIILAPFAAIQVV